MSDPVVKSFPEPTQWNGDDTRPFPSGGGKSGPSRKALKDSLYAAVRIYGGLVVRNCLDEVLEELE